MSRLARGRAAVMAWWQAGGRWHLEILAATVALLVLAAGMPAIAGRVRASPYFAIAEIVATPTSHVRAGALLEGAGLRPGLSLWDVDPGALAARLEDDPWIRRATVRREFPRRLVVELVERRPAAILLVDRLYYVDASGVAFAPLPEHDPLALPLVTGLETAIMDGEAPYARHATRSAVHLLDLLASSGLPFRVSEVHIERERGITVFPATPSLALTFGWGRFGAKLARLVEVLEAFAGREGQIQEVDLTFDAQAVIRLRQPGESGGRRRRA